ncbi:hypothetical protein, partial [Parafrankia sp. BMG5.11]|uniref:hypothetical protein n=1 Tax=Parafrankia sp. BMG5.11 TaxID=222540 RepID=UPI001A9DDC5F
MSQKFYRVARHADTPQFSWPADLRVVHHAGRRSPATGHPTDAGGRSRMKRILEAIMAGGGRSPERRA